MRVMYGIAVVVIVGMVLSAAPGSAGTLPPRQAAAVEQEIRDALLAEQRALLAGGCEAALAFFSEREPLFVSNGRTMATKAAVRSNCGSTPPAGEGPRRDLQGHEVQVLSSASGYSVTTYRAKNGRAQVVTKIWEKGNGGWKIVHTHISDSRG